MATRSLSVRIVALIAAYALALQGVLAVAGPAVPPALAAQLAVLCSGDAPTGPVHSPDHAPRCKALCAGMGTGNAGPPPPVAVAAVGGWATESTLAPARSRSVVRVPFRSPQIARGPPNT